MCGPAGGPVGEGQPMMASIPAAHRFQWQAGVRQEESPRGQHLLFGSSNEHNNAMKVLTAAQMSAVWCAATFYFSVCGTRCLLGLSLMQSKLAEDFV